MESQIPSMYSKVWSISYPINPYLYLFLYIYLYILRAFRKFVIALNEWVLDLEQSVQVSCPWIHYLWKSNWLNINQILGFYFFFNPFSLQASNCLRYTMHTSIFRSLLLPTLFHQPSPTSHLQLTTMGWVTYLSPSHAQSHFFIFLCFNLKTLISVCVCGLISYLLS